jgi:hypothetical protein
MYELNIVHINSYGLNIKGIDIHQMDESSSISFVEKLQLEGETIF